MTDPFAPLHELLHEGTREEIFTAAAALAGLKGNLRWQGAAGRISQDPESPVVNLDTVFDLASLTKPLATALAVMLLMDRGRLSLDATLGEVLSDLRLAEDKKGLSLRTLLAHRAGLPAWRPFYEELLKAPPEDRPQLLTRLAAATPLEYPPESATLYSDLGYFLLHAVIEQQAGESLDAFCHRNMYRPLGLSILGFNPRQSPGGDRLSFAATESGLIPGRNIFGEVHDENAWAAGGVAGHAGLFGTGPEVFSLLATLYKTYQGRAVAPFQTASVRLFLTPVSESARALGFDILNPEPGQSSPGRFFSPRSVGHLGFTGTSFWIDLEKGQMAVLLTNRVHLGRNNDKIRAFRPRFHEAVSRALGLAS